ncbi:MAG: glycosyltransferase family 4 protein [Candidatus Sumerlaeaceae bacterium]
MRILFLHQHFHPETVGTSTRAVEIVEYLVQHGHDVTVVTGIPSHPSTMTNAEVSRDQPRFEEFRGAHLYRTWAYGSSRRDAFLRRMLTYGSFMILGGFKALFLRGKFDVLVAISPLPNGVAAWMVSRLRRLPLMFDVCDIWPDCAVAVGMLNRTPMLRLAQWLEKRVYLNSRRIGVVTPGFTDNIAGKGIPRETISLLPDWVDPDIYDPAKVDREATRLQYDLDGKFVVSFLGNFGLLMGLEAILDIAQRLRDRAPDVLFLFVGKGVALPMMQDRVDRESLQNVRILPYQPRAEVPGLLVASDVLIVTYKTTDITMITVPSKIYEYLAIARPIVAGVEGVIREILLQSGAGFISPSRDPEEMAEFILRLKADPALRAKMGARGRQYAIEHFSFGRVAADYERTIGETLSGSATR